MIYCVLLRAVPPRLIEQPGINRDNDRDSTENLLCDADLCFYC